MDSSDIFRSSTVNDLRGLKVIRAVISDFLNTVSAMLGLRFDEVAYPNPRQRVQARIVFAFQLAYALTWLAYVVLYSTLGAYLSAGICLLSGVLPSVIGVALLRFGHQINIAGLLSNIGSASALFLLTFTTGGAGSAIVVWLLAVVVGTYLQLGKRMGHMVCAYIITLVVIVGLLDSSYGNALFELPFPEGTVWFLCYNYVFAFFISALIISIFSQQFEDGYVALQEAELRYRLLLNYLPVGVFHYDDNLVITYCNQRFADILNNSVDHLVGLDMKILRDPSIMPALGRVIENELEHYEGRYSATFSDADIDIAMTCAPSKNSKGEREGGIAIVQDISARMQAEAEIKNLAFYDPLTRLPNRRLLMDRVKQALASSKRSSRQGAILFIDLDNFKTINDTLGHDIGDQLLKQVSQRLETCVREGDTIARLGGDEFVVMLEDLSEHAMEAAAQAETVGEKILSALNQPYQLAGHNQHSTPSIGVTLFGSHEQSQDELLKQADIAMYQAKKVGRNTLRFFDPQMQDTISARASLEFELRRAVAEQEEFQLYYQVQVDSSERPIGAEALLRWKHPARGMVSPADFIPLAEESGLILPLGHWVLATACEQLASWAKNPGTAHLTMAVNISAKQFGLQTFVEEVLALVDHFQIDPARLKLEITESMLASNIEELIAKMNALKSRGINFSMDDFGTGYSSLQYLKRLPLGQLKIDQSFVRDIAADSSDRAIVKTVIVMAHSLDLDVIAEGVETEEQRKILMKKGCTRFQGYLFGKPLPIDQFDAMLK